MPGIRLRQSIVLLTLCLATFINAQPTAVIIGSDNTYEQALELFRKGQYGNAQKLFDKVAGDEYGISRETRISANYYAALSAMRLFNKDAESRVEDFAGNYKLSPLKNRLYLEYANYRFSTRRYRDAAEYYQKVDRFNLKGEELNEYLFKSGYALMINEESEPAREMFFELKGKESSYANSARYYYAHILYTDSNYSEALTNFLPLQDDESFGRLVPYYLAQIYYRLDDYDKLLEVGEELIENATKSRAPEIAKLVADAFYHKGDYRNTLKYMEIYRDKGGKMRYGDHFQLGYAYYKMGQYRPAIESFNKITSGKDDLLQNAYYHLGDAYLRMGDKKQAISAFSAAAAIKASVTIQEDAYFNYAKLVYEISDPYRDAISVLNDFMEEFPTSPHVGEINRYLANLYITTKDYSKAMLAIQRTGLKAPEMQEVYQKVAFYRATEIFNALKYEEAIGKYQESLKYPVNRSISALSHYWIGEAWYRLEDYDNALKAFEAFRNSPGSFNMSEYNRSLYSTAYCYYKKADFQQAAVNFRNFSREAKRKDPRLSDAYLRLADSYLLTGGYLVAADFYNSALNTKTQQADYALFQRAACLGLAGKKEQKIKELDDLMTRFPKSVYAEEALFEKALTNLQMENYDRALSTFNEYIKDHPQSEKIPKAKMQIGLIYSNTDKNNKALTTFKDVVKDYPGTDESIEAVGLARLIYARQNRIPDYLDWVDGLDFVSFDEATQDSTAFNAAFDRYSSDSCEQAITGFNNYLSRFPKGIFALKVHYYRADCATALNRLSVAQQSYSEIVKLPRNEYTAEALEKLANYTYQGKEYARARTYYRQLAEIAQVVSKKIVANAGIMRTANLLEDPSEAAVYADLVLGMETSDAKLVLEARQIAARSYYKTGNMVEALERYNTIISSNEGEAKAEALYTKADILYQQKDYDNSREVIYKLIEDLPSFKEYKIKALILLARNFWKQDDIFQANHTLDFVIKSDYSPQLVQEATILKEDIKRSQEQKEKQRQEQVKSKAKPILLNNSEGLILIEDGEEVPAIPDTLSNK